MRFSAAIQPSAPRSPAPVAALAQDRDPQPVRPVPEREPLAPEVPPDLDQRVRLSGEW